MPCSVFCVAAECALATTVRPVVPGLDDLMGLALAEAEAAPAHGDVPIGAVVVGPDGAVIAGRHNERELHADPTAHAELLALRDAAAHLGGWRLDGCVLVSTIEPCPSACGSLYNLGADPRLNHAMTIVPGVRADEAALLLRRFFAGRRSPGGS
jgi:tRNA(adenine34) deaminase